MSVLMTRKRVARTVFGAGVLAAVLAAGSRAGAQPAFSQQITEAAVQGFGDRHNSQAWAMAWWRGKLYVGTGRSTYCLQSAALAYFYPDRASLFYPPKDADVDCTPDPHDLPLQAEIWRWTPETDTWEMLYRAPRDFPIQGTDPVKYTSRDIGYRGMLVFTEADGTEALYVSGVTSRAAQGVGIHGPVPPPRILRCTDGDTFLPIPQDPGTFLGDTTVTGFRSMLSYKGRFYVVASVGLLGHGHLFEAEHPEQGNNAFRRVSPMRSDDPTKDLTFFEIETYNGFLYAGTGVQPTNDDTPFSVLKTDATGTPPYTFTTVIPEGAHRAKGAGAAVISMGKFKGHLYVGTEREVLRVNRDDTWDLVVGLPRTTPDGRKLEPLSGFTSGFDNTFNIHMWRMGRHDGWFYIGTQDQSAKWRDNFLLGPLVQNELGADLFSTSDGWHYSRITRTGLGDSFNNGMRNLVSTPYGLFLGTANHTYGTRIYRDVSVPGGVALPERLEVERTSASAILTWEGSPTATGFHVFREEGFGNPREIGATDPQGTARRLFVDSTVQLGRQYLYYVVAEDALGTLSGPSNTARVPVLSPIPTFTSLQALLAAWRAPRSLTDLLDEAQAAVSQGDFAKASRDLARLRAMVSGDLRSGSRRVPLVKWRAHDLDVLLGKFLRRVSLVEAGLMPARRLTRMR